MNSKEELALLRQKIDALDSKLLRLYGERMSVSLEIAGVKAAGNIALVDERRERQVLEGAAEAVAEADRAGAATLMRTLMALSKIRQREKLGLTDPALFPEPTEPKRDALTVAFQGVPGAWGEHGANQLFPGSATIGCDYFEDVFETVKAGRADCGVLPIENSQTGAIGEVYDLLRRHSCYITGQIWISVAQCLLAREGAALSDIREVYSHPEGFGQCRRFLKNKNWELTACRNTAVAAKLVAEKGGDRYAAIGSRAAARVHGLSVLAPDIMDDAQNKTRFIAIAACPVYDERCDITSITFSTAHRSGALCAVLESFMLAGINLSRIESRPASNERYRFFADLQANIMDADTRDALRLASTQCDYFEVLGCYGSSAETI